MSMNVNTTYDRNFFDKSKRKITEKADKAFTGHESTDGIKAGFSNKAASVTKTNDVSGKNEAKLSEKAQEYLKTLREKYGQYDFMIGNSADDLRTLSQSGSKEFSVIFSNAELERMAEDENYAAEKMQSVENSVNMCRKICEEQGYVSAVEAGKFGIGTINKIGVISDDNGNIKFFAELEKTSEKFRERLEKSKEKKAEEKAADEKRANRKNPYEKDTKESVKRATVEAKSYNELLDKLDTFDWSMIADSKSGDRFDFSV